MAAEIVYVDEHGYETRREAHVVKRYESTVPGQQGARVVVQFTSDGTQRDCFAKSVHTKRSDK